MEYRASHGIESPDPTAAFRSPAPTGLLTAALPPRRILLAEDCCEVAAAMRQALIRLGFAVAVVHDGQEAVEQIRGAPPDLAILDVDMPGLTGLEVCAYMRRHPALAHLPVIICTGRCGPDDRQRAYQAGATEFLAKPFLLGELHQSVQAALAAGVPHSFGGESLSPSAIGPNWPPGIASGSTRL